MKKHPSPPLPAHQILIHQNRQHIWIAYLEQGLLCGLYMENNQEPSLIGCIYKAQVQKKPPGIDAFFVTIQKNQSAFLHTKETLNKKTLSVRRPQMVQVIKDSFKGKTSRVSLDISLAGTFLVLKPLAPQGTGLSKRITKEETRRKLQDIIHQLSFPNGVIVRTNAQWASPEQIKQDFYHLQKRWSLIQKKYRKSKAPALIHQEEALVFQVLKTLFTSPKDTVITDNKTLYNQIKKFVCDWWPEREHQVSFYNQARPLFETHHIEEELDKALRPKVWLPSGGFVVIEETEAGTMVDVNTGKFKERKSTEQTFLQINMEAAKEITRQLMLRNIGGIIIIDFIDMKTPAFQDQLMDFLEDQLSKDLSPTRLLPLSELGIVQMTRKRNKASLLQTFYEPCPECEGQGYIRKTNF